MNSNNINDALNKMCVCVFTKKKIFLLSFLRALPTCQATQREETFEGQVKILDSQLKEVRL